MTKKIFNGKQRNVAGERGLVAAVIGRATDDAVAGCPEARKYFAGKVYRHHLAWLDLAGDMLPAVFDNGTTRRTGTRTYK